MRRCVLSQPIAVMLLASYLSACHYYATPGAIGPEAYMAQKQPKKIRVTLTNSRQVTLTTPWITSDSVGGAPVGDVKWDDEARDWVRREGGPWAASRQHVAKIEVYRSDPIATTALIVLVAALPLIVVITWASYCNGQGRCAD